MDLKNVMCFFFQKKNGENTTKQSFFSECSKKKDLDL